MSASSDPLVALTLAVQQLQLSVDSLTARLLLVEEKLDITQEGWELVEEAFEPPGRPSVPCSSHTCPDIPGALLSFAEKLSSTHPGHLVRAKRAFEAGFRAKCSVETGSWFCGATTKLPISDTVWIIVQAPGLSSAYRVATKADLKRLCSLPGKGDVICQGFPSLTEAQIFCAGCDIAVPPLYRWKKQ